MLKRLYITINEKKKESTNSKQSNADYMGGYGRQKGKEEVKQL